MLILARFFSLLWKCYPSKIVISIIFTLYLELEQIDVKIKFLYSDLEEDI